MNADQLFDVVAVDFSTNKCRLIDKGKTLENAEAIVKIAVMRRGVEEEFFAEVPTGTFSEGDEWDVSKSRFERPKKKEPSGIQKIGSMYYPIGKRGLD